MPADRAPCPQAAAGIQAPRRNDDRVAPGHLGKVPPRSTVRGPPGGVVIDPGRSRMSRLSIARDLCQLTRAARVRTLKSRTAGPRSLHDAYGERSYGEANRIWL